jgi:hypothetical protein
VAPLTSRPTGMHSSISRAGRTSTRASSSTTKASGRPHHRSAEQPVRRPAAQRAQGRPRNRGLAHAEHHVARLLAGLRCRASRAPFYHEEGHAEHRLGGRLCSPHGSEHLARGEVRVGAWYVSEPWSIAIQGAETERPLGRAAVSRRSQAETNRLGVGSPGATPPARSCALGAPRSTAFDQIVDAAGVAATGRTGAAAVALLGGARSRGKFFGPTARVYRNTITRKEGA